ncbi:hypothetical protein Q7P35_000914 [Cladosporium inversicolor]
MSYMQEQAKSWARRSYERGNDSYRPTYPDGRNGASFGERRGERAPVSSGYKRSLSPSPLTSRSGIRNPEGRRDSRFDVQPPSRSVRATPQSEEVVPGVIMSLPKGFVVGAQSTSRLLQDQTWVNERAAGHPVVVWDTYPRGGELIARCLPMTSFKSTRVEEKYNTARVWRHWLEYVPIMQRQAVESDANMPLLALADGETMRQQTYVHLDHFFDIESSFLQVHGHNARFGRSMHLEDAALSVLVFKFHQFISGGIERPRASIRSPLDRYGAAAPVEKLARPVLGQRAWERMREGRELETARHRDAGTREWTGHEREESPFKGEQEPDGIAVRPFTQTSDFTQWAGPRRRLFQD